MAQLRTQLISITSSYAGGLVPAFADNADESQANVVIQILSATEDPPNVALRFTEYNNAHNIIDFLNGNGGANPYPLTRGDSINWITGVYTFADGSPNRWQTPTIGPLPPEDYVINQVLDPNLASRSIETHADGTAEVLSKLTSVLGTQNQIDVTVTEGQVQIGLAQDLQFNSLEVNGDAAIHGNLVVDQTISAPTLNASTQVTAPTVSATGTVTAPTISATTAVTAPTLTATGAVNAAYLVLENYPDETQIPRTVPAGALVRVNQIVGMKR